MEELRRQAAERAGASDSKQQSAGGAAETGPAGLRRWEDLDPAVQSKIRGGSPFAGGQDESARYDADGNLVGKVFYDTDGRATLHPADGGPPISIDEQGTRWSGLDQAEVAKRVDVSLAGRSVFAIPAESLGTGVLVDTSAIPAEALPASAIPAEFSRGDAIPAELLPPDLAIPSNALAIPSNLIPPGTLVDSSALPAALIPEGFARGQAIPAEAIPSNAIPAEALPAAAIPSNAIPAEIATQLAIPSNAIPAEALPAAAIPSNLIPPGTDIATWAIPAEALPASYVGKERIPIEAIPAEAIPAEGLPAAALPAAALPAATRAAEDRLKALRDRRRRSK